MGAFGSELAAFVVGAGTVTVGNVISHRYTLKRDRNRDIVEVLDRAIEAFTAADHAVGQFLARVGTGWPPPELQLAADRVAAQEVQLRAATTSLALRMGDDHPLAVAFKGARDQFGPIYLLAGPALQAGATGPEALADSFAQTEVYRDSLDSALAEASEALRSGSL